MPFVGGFPWESPMSPTLSFRRCSMHQSPSSALKTSLLRAVKITSEEFWTSLNSEVLRADEGEANAGMKGRGKREITEKTRQPAASSDTIPACENPGVTRRAIESETEFSVNIEVLQNNSGEEELKSSKHEKVIKKNTKSEMNARRIEGNTEKNRSVRRRKRRKRRRGRNKMKRRTEKERGGEEERQDLKRMKEERKELRRRKSKRGKDKGRRTARRSGAPCPRPSGNEGLGARKGYFDVLDDAQGGGWEPSGSWAGPFDVGCHDGPAERLVSVCGPDGVWSRGRICGNPGPWSVPAGAAKRWAAERIPVGELSWSAPGFPATSGMCPGSLLLEASQVTYAIHAGSPQLCQNEDLRAGSSSAGRGPSPQESKMDAEARPCCFRRETYMTGSIVIVHCELEITRAVETENLATSSFGPASPFSLPGRLRPKEDIRRKRRDLWGAKTGYSTMAAIPVTDLSSHMDSSPETTWSSFGIHPILARLDPSCELHPLAKDEDPALRSLFGRNYNPFALPRCTRIVLLSSIYFHKRERLAMNRTRKRVTLPRSVGTRKENMKSNAKVFYCVRSFTQATCHLCGAGTYLRLYGGVEGVGGGRRLLDGALVRQQVAAAVRVVQQVERLRGVQVVIPQLFREQQYSRSDCKFPVQHQAECDAEIFERGYLCGTFRPTLTIGARRTFCLHAAQKNGALDVASYRLVKGVNDKLSTVDENDTSNHVCFGTEEAGVPSCPANHRWAINKVSEQATVQLKHEATVCVRERVILQETGSWDVNHEIHRINGRDLGGSYGALLTEDFSVFEAEKRGSDKGDTATHIKCADTVKH
ncbi:hypothetical protein PR048_025274, partial [Dryococelus australis]